MLRLYQIAVTAKTAVLRTLFYFLKDRPQIGNYESYYSGSQQCGSYFSLDIYPVKLLSGQHCALLKKMAHQPGVSKPSGGTVQRLFCPI